MIRPITTGPRPVRWKQSLTSKVQGGVMTRSSQDDAPKMHVFQAAGVEVSVFGDLDPVGRLISPRLVWSHDRRKGRWRSGNWPRCDVEQARRGAGRETAR